MLGQRGDEEDILVLQRYISGCALHDALQVNRQDLLGAVGLHTTNDSPGNHSTLSETIGILNQCAHTRHLLTQIIHTRTENGTLHLNHVLEAVDDRIY